MNIKWNAGTMTSPTPPQLIWYGFPFPSSRSSESEIYRERFKIKGHCKSAVLFSHRDTIRLNTRPAWLLSGARCSAAYSQTSIYSSASRLTHSHHLNTPSQEQQETASKSDTVASVTRSLTLILSESAMQPCPLFNCVKPCPRSIHVMLP